jgi:hypothetical protein
MTVTCEVLEELSESFVGKCGPKTVPLWVCLDWCREGALRNTFDYEGDAEEQAKFGGKAAGNLIELAIMDIRGSVDVFG